MVAKFKPSKQDLIAYGHRLKELRNSLNLKVSEISVDYDVSMSTWAKYEKGLSVIRPDVYKKLEKEYNLKGNLFCEEEKPDNLMSFGERFYKVRTLLDIEYDVLAKRLLVLPETINCIEKDKRMQVPIHLLENMVKIFNVNLNWLFTGNGDIFKK